MAKNEVAKTPEVIDLPAMTKNETARLLELEDIIKDNFIGFYKVGCALREINQSRLYRETHENFESYCKDIWDMSKSKGHRYIEASNTYDVLSPIGDKIPDCEAQIRPLTLIKDDDEQVLAKKRIAAWKKAIESAPDGKITARHVESVVREIRGESAKRKFKNIKKKSYEAKVSFEFKQAYSHFVTALEEEKGRCKGKKKLEDEVIRMLDDLELVFRQAN